MKRAGGFHLRTYFGMMMRKSRMFMMMRIDLTISTTSITISMFIVMKMTNPIQSFVCFRKFRMAHELEIDKVLVILFHSVVCVCMYVCM